MKNIIPVMISAMLTILVSLSTAAADGNVEIIEMGESGQTVSFPLTDKEVADRVETRSPKTEVTPQPAIPLHIFELTESGIRVTFPMTKEDVLEQKQIAGRLENRRLPAAPPEPKAELFELAESGIVIRFEAPAGTGITENKAYVPHRIAVND